MAAGLVGAGLGAVAAVVTAIGSAESEALAGGTLWFGTTPLLVPSQWSFVGALMTALAVVGVLALGRAIRPRRSFWTGFLLIAVVAVAVSWAMQGPGVIRAQTEPWVYVATELARSPLAALGLIFGLWQVTRSRPDGARATRAMLSSD